MISVVCVYNDEETLKRALLGSLRHQTAEFQQVLLDNRDGRFRSAAEALNYGARQAKGDYIMFVHQDVWLASKSWLEDVESILNAIPDLGVAGVAGVSENGRNWEERVRLSIEVLDAAYGIDQITSPEEVQTLDECLLIVPRRVFDRLQFDEETFDGWDSYGADYCLSVKRLGLRAYVIPATCGHSCARRAGYQLWEYKNLLKYQKRLYEKHHKHYGRISTWMEELSWLHLKLREIMAVLGPFYLSLFPPLDRLLQKELSGCERVLDLGCGHHSPLGSCRIPYSVGVELFEPSLQESRRKRIHTEYVKADIRAVVFKPKSFDAVIAVEVLEHLTREEGVELLGKMAGWAKKKVIITTPNGYMWQGTCDSNPLQEHRSGWTAKGLRQLGFRVRGLAGWKGLRGCYASIKYKPAFLWARVSDITQKVTWYWAEQAFQLLAVRDVSNEQAREPE